MNVTEKGSTGLTKTYAIQIPAADIAARVDKQLNVIGAGVTIPGFRKGKAPVAILRKNYGLRAWQEAAEKSIDSAVDKVINDNKLKPVTQPKIELNDFQPEKDITLSLSVEISPEIKLMDFATISLTRRLVSEDEQAVSETIDSIRQNNKTYIDTPPDTKAALSDTVVIDFDGEAEDVGKLPGMKGSETKLELGSNSFIAGFEDQLVGAQAGETRIVHVTFPQEYHQAQLAGKNATFETKIHAVQHAQLPEADDALAQQIGFGSFDEFRKAVERDVRAELDRLARLAIKRDLLDTLDKNHIFDVPQGLVDLEYKEIERQAGEQPDPAELAELKAIAERRVRLGLVLTEVGEQNGVTVSPEELRAAAIAEARRYPGQESKIFEMFQKRPEMLARLRAPIFEEKVIDLILAKAQVKELGVSREDLIKYLEEADTYTKPE